MDDSKRECNEEINSILKELESLKLCGPLKQKMLRIKAHSIEEDVERELKMILHLVESHIPGLRIRAEMECDHFSYENESSESLINGDYLNSFTCRESDITILLRRVAELPKEWTVIQITPQFSSKDIFAVNLDELALGGIHMTIFNCGEIDDKPYCVTLPSSNSLLLRSEMRKLKNSMKEIYSTNFKNIEFISKRAKKMYDTKKSEMEYKLQNLLEEVEEILLGGWNCLLMGKYTDISVESEIRKLVDQFLKEKSLEPTSKTKNILIQTAKCILCSNANTYSETILEYCFPGININSSWQMFWKNHPIDIQNKERYPIILIVDEALDAIPWEMISTLRGQPVSRMPSFHLLYALYKTHEDTIVDGYKIISDYNNGKFILNPGLDLKLMERRMKSFFDYWLPEWNGLSGQTPTSTEFLDLVTSAQCFCYSGHGSGAQYCSSERIQKNKIDSVVFLFGCGSTQLLEQGTSVEMYGISQLYSLTGCPCLIGMLHVVTDRDTDIVTSNLLSTWIPNEGTTPWSCVNVKEWIEKGIIKLDENASTKAINEPDLLKALCKAKDKMLNFCNKAAVVARGIPVKLANK